MHQLIEQLPDELPDPIPEPIRAARGLPPRGPAIAETHFPPASTPQTSLNLFRTAAQQRLIFEEFFLFQAGLVLRKRRQSADRKARAVEVDDRIRESARRVLPFKLTDGQRTALAEIVEDMQRPEPMNRLLQGDVGAGKTIVALLAALVAMENGLQVAFMAPTEILADQHYLTIRRLLDASRFRVALADRQRRRREAARRCCAEIASGAIAPGRRHARAGRGARRVPGARPRRHRRAASLRRACSARTLRAKGCEPRRAGDDGDADSAHAGADGVRRSRRVGDSRAAAGTAADQDAGEAGVATRRGLRALRGEIERGRQVYVDLSAGRGVGEGRSAGGDGDGRALHAEMFPAYRVGAAARRHEAGREGARDGRVRARRACTCSSRRRSSKSASTCRTRP